MTDRTNKPGQRLKLLRTNLGLSQGDVARKCGWESQSRISHYENEDRRIDRTDAIILAKALESTPEWIMFGDTGLLRKNEVELHLNDKIPLRGVPIITWAEAKRGIEAVRGTDLSNNKLIPYPYDGSPHRFALEVYGDAMVSTVPGARSFPPGERIIIDPTILAPNSGKFVIADIPNTPEAIFRQYVIDAGIPYLKPLNPQYAMIKVDDSITLCGVVVGYSGEI